MSDLYGNEKEMQRDEPNLHKPPTRVERIGDDIDTAGVSLGC